ncbi:MAG: RhuM family protein [Desulfobacteria bacterium]
MTHDKNPPEPAEILLYQTEDGQTRLEVRLQEENVWLTQKRMAELFRKNVRTINEHIQNIFAEGELVPESVIRNFRITADDGKSYETQHYNLDVIISVGYRVKSHRGTQFRIWATRRLREYIIKGFAMDDDRLKRDGGGNYFDELLARIRDIRSSEKVFWRKVLDIYATSIDYDSQAETSQLFFATVQNKMHWAAHGQTAAEIVYQRADSTRENMALTKEKEITMTRNKTPPHIKLDERNHVENPLHSHLNRPDWDIIALIQNLLTGKKCVTPLLTESQEAGA